MKHVALEGSLELVRKPGYVRVWHGRSARTLEEADAVLNEIDQAMDRWQTYRLMFDSRDADRTPADVGARIWSWLSDHPRIERVATLVQSGELADSVDLQGIGNDIRIRSFHAEPAAERWLTMLT